jgi:hypothetical protein
MVGFDLPQNSEPDYVILLGTQHITDLIKCYSASVAAVDVEFFYNLSRADVTINYLIKRETVQGFYDELDRLGLIVKNIIVSWRETSETLQVLKTTAFASFCESAIWMYEYPEGNFNSLQPHVEFFIDQMILQVAQGDYANFVTIVKQAYAA